MDLCADGGFMLTTQASADFSACASAGLQSMYSEKRKGVRGRRLGLAQFGAARLATGRKIATKDYSSGVHGYAASHKVGGESSEDSDGDVVLVRQQASGAAGSGGGDVSGTLPPKLPHGQTNRWLRKMPARGSHLVGWCVYVFFDQPTPGWHELVIVEHTGGAGYTIYSEAEDFHEEVTLPDDTIAYLKPGPGIQHSVEVTDDMLP